MKFNEYYCVCPLCYSTFRTNQRIDNNNQATHIVYDNEYYFGEKLQIDLYDDEGKTLNQIRKQNEDRKMHR